MTDRALEARVPFDGSKNSGSVRIVLIVSGWTQAYGVPLLPEYAPKAVEDLLLASRLHVSRTMLQLICLDRPSEAREGQV